MKLTDRSEIYWQAAHEETAQPRGDQNQKSDQRGGDCPNFLTQQGAESGFPLSSDHSLPRAARRGLGARSRRVTRYGQIS